MNEFNTNIYKELYEMQREDVKELKNKLNNFLGENLKTTLGDSYYDFVDYIIVRQLKDIVDCLRQEGYDEFETPDNKARDLSAAYRMIEYYLPPSEYEDWLKELMDQ
tara:strand:- start:713 stop:1033 length:321 start_codon:yes stop_codon:yes gene_type:complete